MRTAEIASRFGEPALNEWIDSHPVWEEAAVRRLDWRSAQLDSTVLAGAAEKLSARARGLLELVLRKFGPLPFDEERLRVLGRLQGRWSGAELIQGLVELRQAGIVFAVRKSWGDELFFLPGDAFGAWLHALFPFCPIPLAREQVRQMEGREGADQAPLSMQILGGLRTMVTAGMQFNANGVLPKKVISKAAARLSMNEAGLEGWAAAFAYRDEYPKPVALLLDLALSQGLLREEENGYVWNTETGGMWLELSAEQRETELAALFVSRYMTADPSLAFPSAALLYVKPFKWYAVSDAAAWLADVVLCGPASDQQSPSASEGLNCCLRIFQACGWLEQGKLKDGTPVFRWRAPDRGGERPKTEPGRIYVQPDCEIIAAQDISYHVRWMLEEVAENAQTGVVTVYRMTQGAVAGAVNKGWTGEGLLQFLQDASGDVVPDNVASLIRQWSRQAGSVSVEQMTLLRCADIGIADQLAAEQPLQGLLGERLGDRAFVIEVQHLDSLLKKLERIGCYADKPQPSVQPEPAGKGRNKSRSSRTQADKPSAELFYDPVGLKHFTLRTEVPEHTPAHEALNRLPASWTRQFRAYHASTKREMLEQALDLHTAVELRTGNSTLSFIPSRLHDADGSWRVEGWMKQESEAEPLEISLHPEMWQEMRLIVPVAEE